MFSFALDYQGFEAARHTLGDLTYRLTDLRPLAARVAEIIEGQNAAARAAGVDQYGTPFWDLAPSTMKKRVRQGRLGPPLAPDGPGSPIIAGFRAEVEPAAPDDVTIRGHWPGVPWVGFHTDNGGPRGHLPVRDPAGVVPEAQGPILDAFEEFVAGLFARTY